MTPENRANYFAGKTQNFEAVAQYQFDFGLRPSIGYVQTKGKTCRAVPVSPAAMLTWLNTSKWVPVLLQQEHERLRSIQIQPAGRQQLYRNC